MFAPQPSLMEEELNSKKQERENKYIEDSAYMLGRIISEGVITRGMAVSDCMNNPKEHENWPGTHDFGADSLITRTYPYAQLSSACEQLHKLAKTEPGRRGANMAAIVANSGLKDTQLTKYLKDNYNFTPPPFSEDRSGPGM